MINANAKILRKVGDAEAFYFSRAFNSFTGQKANSLEEFMQKIKEEDAKCLEFHLHRKDFEKWIEFTIGDFRLAAEFRLLREQKPIGEDLRNRLWLLVSKRISELTKALLLPDRKKSERKKENSKSHFETF
jgi:hypothetical protein